MYNRRIGKLLGLRSFGACVLLLSGCTLDVRDSSESGSSDEQKGNAAPVPQVAQALDATDLAYPEYDINVPVGYWWMHSASFDTISAKMKEGYRLISIDALPGPDRLWTAAFVSNTSSYERAGQTFAYGYDASTLATTVSGGVFRATDIAAYDTANGVRYGVVWVPNSGELKKRSKVVLGVSWSKLTEAAESGAWRLMDVDSTVFRACFACAPVERYHGVFIENSGNDARTQTFFSTTDVMTIKDTIGSDRLTEIEPSALRAGAFVGVVENRNSDERSWWGTSLFFDSVQNTLHPDSLVHAPIRFGGRYTKLKPYMEGGQLRYAAILVNAADVPTSGSSPSGNTALTEIDDLIKRRMKAAGVPGLSLAITSNGQLVHARGYGHSNLATPRRTQPIDMFRIASVSKVIGATAILRMIQDRMVVPRTGKPLTLDTRIFGDIYAYTKPASTPNLNDITIRHLLEHRTGLADDFEWLATTSEFINKESTLRASSFPRTNCKKISATGPFFSSPGAADARCYKNSHYHLVTQIVNTIAKVSFDRYVQFILLSPISVNRLQITAPTGTPHPSGIPQAINYERVGPGNRGADADPNDHGDWVIQDHRHAASTYAAAMPDLLRWLSSVDGSRSIVRSIDDTRFDWITSEATDPDDYGLGFDSSPSGTAFDLSHGGYLPGVTVAQMYMRTDGISFAFATNSDGLSGGSLRNAINDILDENPLPLRDLTSQYFSTSN